MDSWRFTQRIGKRDCCERKSHPNKDYNCGWVNEKPHGFRPLQLEKEIGTANTLFTINSKKKLVYCLEEHLPEHQLVFQSNDQHLDQSTDAKILIACGLFTYLFYLQDRSQV